MQETVIMGIGNFMILDQEMQLFLSHMSLNVSMAVLNIIVLQ